MDVGDRPETHYARSGDLHVAYQTVGTDPVDIPAVRAPVPGGPRAAVVSELLTELAARGSLEGIVVTEFEPTLDPNGTSAIAVVRVLCRALDRRLRI